MQTQVSQGKAQQPGIVYPRLLASVAAGGRTFVLREHALGKFRFEVSEQLADGSLIDHASYRLRSLADIDLQRRVRAAAPPRFVPFVVGGTGYVHDDEERLDRLREARADEQEMLRGDSW